MGAIVDRSGPPPSIRSSPGSEPLAPPRSDWWPHLQGRTGEKAAHRVNPPTFTQGFVGYFTHSSASRPCLSWPAFAICPGTQEMGLSSGAKSRDPHFPSAADHRETRTGHENETVPHLQSGDAAAAGDCCERKVRFTEVAPVQPSLCATRRLPKTCLQNGPRAAGQSPRRAGTSTRTQAQPSIDWRRVPALCQTSSVPSRRSDSPGHQPPERLHRKFDSGFRDE